MTYNLWETETRNLISSFHSESEALAFVRQEVNECGIEGLETWALLTQDENQKIAPVAAGTELIDLARRVAA